MSKREKTLKKFAKPAIILHPEKFLQKIQINIDDDNNNNISSNNNSNNDKLTGLAWRKIKAETRTRRGLRAIIIEAFGQG